MANSLKADLGPLRVLWDAGTLAGLDDRALLARFVDDGSGLAFEMLVRRHGPMVLRVCSQLLDDRHAAEDAFQAVFLVLARRAGSIRKPEQLAPWLHGVALRTAWESRSREIRRRQIERRGATMSPTDPGPPEHQFIRAEEAEALHGEVARLPERYRGPVVLCDLEGLTHQEAATRLRCPVGTVAIRLKRARERLRTRLIRRGIDPTAGLMVAAFGPSSHVPIPSTSLIEATVRASTTAGLASASVVSLAQGVQWTMTIAKWKAATAGATLAFGLAATWGVAAGRQAPTQAERNDGPAALARKIETAALKEVRDYEDFLGRTEPSRVREFRPGRLDPEQGPLPGRRRVKSGEMLFEFDPKFYQIMVEAAQSRVAKARAVVNLAKAVEKRNERLRSKDANLVSKEDMDKTLAEVDQAEKELWQANAGLTAAQLERRDATQIRAPFGGEISRSQFAPGSVIWFPPRTDQEVFQELRRVPAGQEIKPKDPLLATLVMTDPMAVGFDVDERTILKLRRMYGDDQAKTAEGLTIRVALLDEKEFSHQATLESLPDKLDPSTGTARFRATIPNPDHRILPGMVARVRLTTGQPREALLVPDSAIMVGGRDATVYTLGDRDVVEERVVKLGQSHGDLRVIREGLKPGDRVLTGDLKDVKPGLPLKP